LAPDLFEFSITIHHRAQKWGSILHPIPVAHGQFPAIAAIVGEVLEQKALHLPGNLCSVLNIEHATLLLEEFVKLRESVKSKIDMVCCPFIHLLHRRESI
jgi:hypothetical protein